MENVYVIKVKTKPALFSLYPSERRYSASTVGGLALVHFALGALSLLLGTLALSLQGPVLCVACLLSFVTGLLAWRRWYINRNISIFFYANLFSLIIASLCFVATIFDIAAISENSKPSIWSLEQILTAQPDRSLIGEPTKESTARNLSTYLNNGSFDVVDDDDDDNNDDDDKFYGKPNDMETSTFGYPMDNPEETAGSTRSSLQNEDSLYDILRGEASLVYERKMFFPTGETSPQLEPNNATAAGNRSVGAISDKVLSFWQRSQEASTHTKVLLTANVLVASLLEALWSLLSARIALRGMLNRLPETDYSNNVPACSKADAVTGQRKKQRAPKPDILDHHRGLPENLRHLSSLRGIQAVGPSLPSPESNREFRERVERFLANQAAHRTTEGSSS